VFCLKNALRQSDNDVTRCDDHRQNEGVSSDSTDVAAATTVSLVAVSSQKCASSETLKEVDDAKCDMLCSDQPSNDVPNPASLTFSFIKML